MFLLPSIHEPFGIVVLEAWAAGLPVVASRVGGIPSFVADGEDGMLFDPADVGQFLAVFQETASNRTKSRELGAAGRTKARNEYSWNRITDRLARIYEEVVNENPLRK